MAFSHGDRGAARLVPEGFLVFDEAAPANPTQLSPAAQTAHQTPTFRNLLHANIAASV
jgi:hypothetical protein